MNPEKARALIQQGVRRGIERRKELKSFPVAHPVKLEVLFRKVLAGEQAPYIPGVERTSGNTIAFTACDMVEASKSEGVLEIVDPQPEIAFYNNLAMTQSNAGGWPMTHSS